MRLCPLATLAALVVGGCAAPSLNLHAASAGASIGAAPLVRNTPPPNCGKYGPCSIIVCFKAPVSCVAFATDGSVQNVLTSGLSSPQGVAADRDGNVYIADAGNAEIFEYGPQLKTLIKTYTDPGERPVDVAVDSAAQLLVVSNGYIPSVSVYASGSTSPTAVLTDPNAPDLAGIGIALDGHDNCFWSLGQSNDYKIDEFAGCSGEPTKVYATKRMLGGLAFDEANNLYFVERRGFIKRGGYGPHGEIFWCIGTTQCAARYKGRAGAINFDQRWKFLWTVTPEDDFNGLQALAYWSGKKGGGFEINFGYGTPTGVAHVPGPG